MLFTQWVQEHDSLGLADIPFLERGSYGMYLQALEDAKDLGVVFETSKRRR